METGEHLNQAEGQKKLPTVTDLKLSSENKSMLANEEGARELHTEQNVLLHGDLEQRSPMGTGGTRSAKRQRV